MDTSYQLNKEGKMDKGNARVYIFRFKGVKFDNINYTKIFFYYKTTLLGKIIFMWNMNEAIKIATSVIFTLSTVHFYKCFLLECSFDIFPK